MILDASVLDRLGLTAWLALSIRATLVLAIGAVAAWLLRRRSAAARHFVWLLTLNAVLGVTAFATLTRGVAVTVPRWPQWATEGREVLPSAEARSGARGAPAPPMVMHEDVPRGAGVHESAYEASAPAGAPVAKAPVTAEPPATKSFATEPPATEPPATRALPTRPAAVVSPGSWLILLWLAGALFVLGRLVLGHAGLAWIARRSRVVADPAWGTLLRSLAHEAGVAQVPRLCSSAAVGSPLVCGLLRPMILLPVDAGSWDAERRRVVLLHELAHIARRDLLTQAIAWLACAIYWFQPAAWLAFARLRAEGERACDDRVLSTGVAGPDYASHLLGVARRARALRLAGAVSLAMARRSTLEGRLLALLDDGVRRGALGVRARGAGVTALAVVLVALGLVRPVPPAAAVPPAVSPEPGSAAVPAARPSPAHAAHRAEAIPAEPLDWIAAIPSGAPAVDPPATLAPGETPAFDRPESAAVIPSAAPATERVDAGAAVAQSVVERFDAAGSKADSPAASFRADPPAKQADTPAHDSHRAAAPTWSTSLSPALLASAPATAPAPVAGKATWNNRAGGLWSDPSNWTPAGVPNATGRSAVLPDLGGPYQVSLDISPKVDAIQIEAGATLDVNGSSLAAAQLVTNSGTIRNFAGVYTSTKIRNLTGGTVLVAPGGTIQIADYDLWNAGTIVAAKEIHWGGSVGLSGGGTLVLDGTRLFDPNNDPDPNLPQADFTYMTIGAGTTVRGTGKIDKDRITNAGVIQADVAQLAKVNNVTTPPEKVLWFNGTITNNGTIRVMNGGHINVNRPAIYNRYGVITSGPGGGSLRLEMPFKMFGSIDALAPVGGQPPPATGSIIRADGGDLEIGVNAMNLPRFQRGPGGGVVKLAHVTMRGATVDAGAEVHFEPRVVYGAVSWENGIPTPVADAPILDLGGIVGEPLGVSTITNNGTIRFTLGLFSNAWGGGQTVISGTGELILDGATIGTGAGGTFVNGAGHTIRGCGTINAPFLNEGTVALECSAPRSAAHIGGRAVPAKWTPEGQVTIPGAAIENRGRISIARGDLSITGPEAARHPIEVAAPTVVTNKGTISAAGGNITLEKSVTLDNTGGGVLSAAGGNVYLGGTTSATVIGGRLDASSGARPRKAVSLRGAPGFDNDFRVDKLATLRDVTLGPAATLFTAAGGVTTASGSRVVNDGTNRIAGTFVVTPGTSYIENLGETLLEGGDFLGSIYRGPGRGAIRAGVSSASIAAGPAELRFYARTESRNSSFVLELPHAADVEGRVYDAAGREVARIAEGAREAGVYRFALGRSGGASLPSGVYFGRMVVTSAGVRNVLQSRIAVID